MTQKGNPAGGDGGAGEADQAVGRIVSTNIAAAERALAVLRCARLRSQLLIAEIDSVGIALRGGLLTPEAAIDWTIKVGAFAFLEDAP